MPNATWNSQEGGSAQESSKHRSRGPACRHRTQLLRQHYPVGYTPERSVRSECYNEQSVAWRQQLKNGRHLEQPWKNPGNPKWRCPTQPNHMRSHSRCFQSAPVSGDKTSAFHSPCLRKAKQQVLIHFGQVPGWGDQARKGTSKRCCVEGLPVPGKGSAGQSKVRCVLVGSGTPQVLGLHDPLADGALPTITCVNKLFRTLGGRVGHSWLRGRARNLEIEHVNQVGHIGALAQDQTGHIGCSVGQVSRQRPGMDRGTGSGGGGLSTGKGLHKRQLRRRGPPALSKRPEAKPFFRAEKGGLLVASFFH